MVNDYRDAIRVNAICLSLCSLLAVTTRIYRSFFILGRLAWHDIFIIIALVRILPAPRSQQFKCMLTLSQVCGVVACIGMALLTTVGLGTHDVDGSITLQDSFQWVSQKPCTLY